MTPFVHKTLIIGLASASILATPETARAVRVNPSGLGQYLIYPYYTVRSDSKGNAFVTGMSVINTTPAVKAVKVRFMEGIAAADVLNFNLYLSPNDVWTGAVVPTATGAKLISFDNSCTVPGPIGSAGLPFANTIYASDPLGGSLDRTREGYFEIIEMGVVSNADVANAATHNSLGVPANCALVRSDTNSQGVNPPTGGLFGGETLINVMAGTDYTADPVALDDFSFVGQWCIPGCPVPNASTVSPPRSVVLTATSTGQEQVVATGSATGWGAAASGSVLDSVSAVSAILMHDNLYNEFVLDAATQSGTDWVITFPTKRFYYNFAAATPTVVPVQLLFQRNFANLYHSGDDFAFTSVFDREEGTTFSLGCFEPPPPGCPPSLSAAANVLTFNGGQVLGSRNSENFATTRTNGWLDIGFPNSAGTYGSPSDISTNHQLVSSNSNVPGVATAVFTPATGTVVTNSSATYFGLPVIGFALNSYLNGTLLVNGQQTLSAYGGNFIHKYTDHIKTP